VNSSFISKEKGERRNCGASTSASTVPNLQARSLCVNGLKGHVAVG